MADVNIRFVSDSLPLRFPPPFPGFLVQDGRPDILIQVHYGSIPPVALGEKLFDTQSFWTLHRSQGKVVVSFISPVFGPEPYSLALLEPDFSRGDLYFRHMEDRPQHTVNPVLAPFDELLLVNYLAQGRGLDIHSCGIRLGERGIIFCGVSGAGKSTTARLWQKRQVPILSDDRIIVRQQEGRFFMHGTPWHGDAEAHLPGKAPLDKLYFLKQAPENYIRPLTPADASKRLLVRCFPPFYLAQGMEFALEFIDQIARQVPCYELGFLPDDSSVEMVLQHVGNE